MLEAGILRRRTLRPQAPGPKPFFLPEPRNPLVFDDQGADFTAWVNHWRTEVYRNWIVPQAVLYGFRSGHVDFEFTVERDGTMSALRMLKSSGVGALDRAAENALRGSRYLPLPGDYRPPRVTLQVTFLYNETPPQGS